MWKRIPGSVPRFLLLSLLVNPLACSPTEQAPPETTRKLDIPGENLDKVSHTLRDPADYASRRLLVVGGDDRAVESALACADAGAQVTLTFRNAQLTQPTQTNRQRVQQAATEGRIELLLGSRVVAIETDTVTLRVGDRTRELPNDAVLVLVGAPRAPRSPDDGDPQSASTASKGQDPRQARRSPQELTEIADLEIASRASIYQPEQVVSALGIRPGDVVADVGAGIGLFSEALSSAVGSEGRVFATDIDPEKIETLNQLRTDQGLDNLYPVLVDIQGVDPFYGTQTFDLVFLCAVYETIGDTRRYFEALRPSLDPEDGRLIIVQYRMDPPFNVLEFSDFELVRTVLRSEGPTFPIATRLEIQTLESLVDSPDTPISATTRERFVDELDQMLEDPHLFGELRTHFIDSLEDGRDVLSVLVNSDDLRMAQWLVYQLTRSEVLDGHREKVEGRDLQTLRRLNRTLILGAFDTEASKPHRVDRPIYFGLASIQATLGLAGYDFVREFDNLLPNHHVWEFRRAR